MAVLLTGGDGYLGWPTALRLARRFPSERIVYVDNLARRRWVTECGSVSALPIPAPADRLAAARSLGYRNLSFIEGDLLEPGLVYRILSVHRPRVIVHLAAQPSAPYSEINGAAASFTQHNNNEATRRLLWGIRELGLTETRLVETTTTGIYGAPEYPIPEGFMEVERGGRRDRIPHPGMASSWYHMSKAHDAANLYLANRQWGLSISELRTGIVYGAETAETGEDPALGTRFDFDFYFGVVVNRFCAQALSDHPLTVYGLGAQRKPLIALEDAVESLARAAARPPDGAYEIFNQATSLVSIRDLAEGVSEAAKACGISVEVNQVPNPRREKEQHLMEMENTAFLQELLGGPPQGLLETLRATIARLSPHRRIVEAHLDRFLSGLPAVKNPGNPAVTS
ncbi:MAG: NAD-dependent epimerase/dehydratase family protein [Firmicutes bacterium]|nr:NAD-dependent epimerase/dehydratase family protein [Bacillota bacterium]